MWFCYLLQVQRRDKILHEFFRFLSLDNHTKSFTGNNEMGLLALQYLFMYSRYLYATFNHLVSPHTHTPLYELAFIDGEICVCERRGFSLAVFFVIIHCIKICYRCCVMQ